MIFHDENHDVVEVDASVGGGRGCCVRWGVRPVVVGLLCALSCIDISPAVLGRLAICDAAIVPARARSRIVTTHRIRALLFTSAFVMVFFSYHSRCHRKYMSSRSTES